MHNPENSQLCRLISCRRGQSRDLADVWAPSRRRASPIKLDQAQFAVILKTVRDGTRYRLSLRLRLDLLSLGRFWCPYRRDGSRQRSIKTNRMETVMGIWNRRIRQHEMVTKFGCMTEQKNIYKNNNDEIAHWLVGTNLFSVTDK